MVKIDLKKTAALWGCIYLFLTIGPFMFWLLPLSLFLAVSLGYICDNLKVVANRTIGFNQRQSIPVRFIFTVYYSFVITLVGTFI